MRLLRLLAAPVLALVAPACVTVLGLDEDRALRQADGGQSTGGAGGSGGVAGAAGSDAYAARVLADGAKAYFRFEETSGSFADSASGGKDAIPLGAVQQGVPGAVGLGAKFDGKSGRARVGDVFDFAGKAHMSVELWVRALAKNRFQYIVHKGYSPKGAEDGWGLAISNDDRLQFSRISAGQFRHAALSPMLFDTWLHIVGTFDGVSARLYVNGKIAETNPIASQVSLPDTTYDLSFGAASTDFGFFDGTIDELAIYDKIVTQTMVDEHRGLAGKP